LFQSVPSPIDVHHFSNSPYQHDALCLQAGFLPTALVSLLFTAQTAHILRHHLTPAALFCRVLLLSGLPCLASFCIDAHHRTRFLRAAADASGTLAAIPAAAKMSLSSG
jgi:hypothetical protein